MAKNNYTFAIDDKLGTAANLVSYAQLLEAMDPALGQALSPYLASLAAGQSVDTAAIWDALYMATASAAPDPAPLGDEATGGEGAR